MWGAPTPSRADPSRLIQTPAAAVAISGRLLADVRRFPSGCSALLEVDRIEARRVESSEVLQRPWTPLADLRRDVVQRLQKAVGPRRGGFLAALVLGGAQVQLSEDIREAFRMAGLSHALAASGFHLSVLLGSVLMLARRLPPGPYRLVFNSVRR
ncbi:ComEC/Rec2 family competence protein [Parasynechococcus sp.]|uniref:ComEC/Rec2 family competence protein n=1 Tax=Parasynechococcus sp. TaxID=3101203 RepID=UPI0037042E11